MADYTTASFAPALIDHTSKVSSTLFSSNPLSFLHEIHMVQQHSLANNFKDGVFELRNADAGAAVSGVLHVTIHQAKDIQNICIYGNQDVYAKLFITHRQDAVYSTRPVKSGGKNPIFNQSLEIPVSGWDAVLKCEVWMMSCAQNYLQDQLLGFALVPIKGLYGKGKQTQEYCLTSTDLFYTPAGTVQLSLSICDYDNVSMGSNMSVAAAGSEGESSTCPPTPNAHEVMMGYEGDAISASNLCKIEFLDLEAESEDQQLVSMYYKMATSASLKEYEPNTMISPDGRGGECSKNGTESGHSIDQAQSEKAQLDKVVSLSHVESIQVVENELVMEDKCQESLQQNEANEMSTTTTAVTIEAPKVAVVDRKPATSSSSVECQSVPASCDVRDKCKGSEAASLPLITTPLVNISIEPEMSINQEHFVDLYLKSMQQFTEKLAEMKFSFDMEAQGDSGAVLTRNLQGEKKDAAKKGPKLYYGSRAFY